MDPALTGSNPGNGRVSLAAKWTWPLALLLLIAEFLVFDRMTARHYAHLFPQFTDQTQYLSEAYTGYEDMRANGFWHGVKTTLTIPAPQGRLHALLALLVFSCAGGASRSAALSLNMLAFLAWQAAVLFAVPRISGSRTLGWMGFGLLLCLWWPWVADAGSAIDFRLDHGAMCLMGVAAACALLTSGFRSSGWSLLFGAAVGVAMAERFLTGAYFAAIFAAAALWIMGGDARAQSLRNLGLAAAVAAVLFLPAIWPSRVEVYKYYWVGHFASREGEARAAGLNLLASLQFIFGHLGADQLGGVWIGTAAAATGVLLYAWRTWRRSTARAGSGGWLFFGLGFLLLPAAVLSAQPEKSKFVLGVLVPGAMLLVLWGWDFLLRRIDLVAVPSARPGFLAILAAAVVAAGEVSFVDRQLRQPYSDEFLADARQYGQLVDYLYTTSRAAGLASPRFGADQLMDFLDGRTMSVFCYERHHAWCWFAVQLPTGIVEENEDVIMKRLGLCDFFLLTETMPGFGYYPFDKEMRRLRPVLKSWCDEHLRRVETFTLFGRKMSLYQRRELP